MTRVTALLVVMVIAGAQASALTCDLVCAAAAVSARADGCHAHTDDATGLRVAPAPAAPCDHAVVSPWLAEVRQLAPKSILAAAVPTADAVGTNAPPTDSTNPRRWRLPESPPPLGSVRPSILRI
jgi:hypothetical protein